jgi:hypothetical protein
MPSRTVARGHRAQQDHNNGEHEAEQAETTMKIHAAGRHQRYLRKEEDNPKRERYGVDVHEQVGKRSVEYSREIISPRKACKYYDEKDTCHGAEESISVAEIARPPDRRTLFCVQGSHSLSSRVRLMPPRRNMLGSILRSRFHGGLLHKAETSTIFEHWRVGCHETRGRRGE